MTESEISLYVNEKMANLGVNKNRAEINKNKNNLHAQNIKIYQRNQLYSSNQENKPNPDHHFKQKARKWERSKKRIIFFRSFERSKKKGLNRIKKKS